MRAAIATIVFSGTTCALGACFSLSDLTGGDDGTDASAEANGGDAVAAGDAAGVDASACDFAARFEAPVKVSFESQPSDDYAARLSADELFMFFARGFSDGGAGIFSASRESTNAPFTGVAAVPSLASSNAANSPSVTADGLTIVFEEFSFDTSSHLKGDIFFASRSDTFGDFGTPQEISNVNIPDAQAFSPFVRSDGQELYFAQFGVGDSRLFRATRSSEGFTNPVPLDELNSAPASFPTVTPDGLTIFWTTSGAAFEIFTAHRPNTSAAFGDAHAVAELNTAADNVPAWISADACTLYFARDTTAGSADFELYAATRKPGLTLNP